MADLPFWFHPDATAELLAIHDHYFDVAPNLAEGHRLALIQFLIVQAPLASFKAVSQEPSVVWANVLTDRRIHWISTHGGRFIALPDASLSHWRGCPDDGRDPLDASHDYGRACATSGYADLLAVGESHALVFGENTSGGVWLESPHPVLFEWMYAASKDMVADVLDQLPVDLEMNATIQHTVASDHLNVFDSAFPGTEFEPKHSCRFSIQPGNYAIASSIYKPNADTGLIIHRFVPA